MSKNFVKKQVMVEKSRCTDMLLRDVRKVDTSRMSMRDRLVVENTKFVVTVANQYRGLGVEVEDLVQTGIMAMIRAAEKFDEAQGVKFISFAVCDIRSAMLREINREGKTVRIPQHLQLSDVQMDRLDLPIGEEGGLTLLDKLANELADDAESAVTEADTKGQIMRLLGKLTPRERDVIIWSFGLSGQTLSSGERYEGDSLLQGEIADEMGLSEESIRLIREKAIEKMRL